VMKNNEKDKHVLAAAVRETAEVIVTFDGGGFPEDAVKEYNIRALHPDDFLLDQIDLYPDATRKAIDGMVDSYDNPPLTFAEVLAALSGQGVPQIAHDALRLFSN